MEIITTIQSWSYPVITLGLLIYCIVNLRNRGGELLAIGFGLKIITMLSYRIVNIFDLYQEYENIYKLLNHINFFFNIVYAGLFIAGISRLASSGDSAKERKMSHEQISFGEIFFSFEGRINRAKYWLYNVLILNSVLVVVILIGGLAGGEDGIGAGYVVGLLLILWPSLALNVKRCHDRNRSGAFFLVSIIPFLNLWYLVEILFLQGTVGDNNYGSDPLTIISVPDVPTS